MKNSQVYSGVIGMQLFGGIGYHFAGHGAFNAWPPDASNKQPTQTAIKADFTQTLGVAQRRAIRRCAVLSRFAQRLIGTGFSAGLARFGSDILCFQVSYEHWDFSLSNLKTASFVERCFLLIGDQNLARIFRIFFQHHFHQGTTDIPIVVFRPH